MSAVDHEHPRSPERVAAARAGVLATGAPAGLLWGCSARSGSVPDPVRAVPRPGNCASSRWRRAVCTRRRHALRLPVRPAAPHLRDRLPPRRRRRSRTARRLLLRPAGVGGAARQLRRDRQGRRPAAPLVPPRAARHQRRRPRHADVVGRHDVRVPDAAAADAQLPRHAARSELPRQRAAPDRLRPAARRAVGHLGVGVRLHRPRGQLPVPRLRRARARPQARPGRRTWSSRRTRRRWPASSRRRPRRENFERLAAGRRSTAASGSTRRSTTPRAAATSTDPPAAIARGPSSCARTSRTTRACRSSRSPTSSARTRSSRASTPIPGSRRPSCCCRSACRARPSCPSRARPRARRGPAVAARVRLAALPSPHTHERAHALPLERPLHDRGHQRRRRLQHVARHRRHAPARRPDIRRRGALHLPARSVVEPGLVRHLSADRARSPTSSMPPSISTRSRSAAATATSRRSSRSPCRPRTTSKCAG